MKKVISTEKLERYFISKLNLAKEIQKNEERIEGAG